MKIDPKVCKTLKEKTGLGLMDCKKALEETEGDIEKAVKILREKGLAKAVKRKGRAAKQGLIHSYIHFNNRVGTLVEVNCETDFVAKNPQFLEFVEEIAQQIAALAPIAIKRENLSKELIDSEVAIYKKQMENQGKPEKIIDKIIEGKMEKFYKEVVLLEQPYFKDIKRTIKDLLDDVTTKFGENIVISRFSRFELGENQ